MELIILLIIVAIVISNNKKKTVQSSKKQHSSYEKSATYSYGNSYGNKNVSTVNNNAAQARKKTYGNEKIGERLVMGDAVSKGMMEVDCPYCGAENLIQPRDRGNCVCYFCRTKL